MITLFEINEQLQNAQEIISKNRGASPSSGPAQQFNIKQSTNNVSNILDKQKNTNKYGINANNNSEQNINTTRSVIASKQRTPTVSIPDTKPQLGTVSRI